MNRQKTIPAHLQNLNPPQREAVLQTDGPVLILAGAGTGKTRVITCRITEMIARGIPAQSIVAMTFTNKAAREMQERVRDLLPGTGSKLRIGTFHSFCLALLRDYPPTDSPGFTIAGSGEQLDLAKKALEERGWSGLYRPADVLARIGQAKNALLSPQELMEGRIPSWFADGDPGTLGILMDLYQRQLRLNRVIDFDDCIYLLVRRLDEDPDLLQRLRKRFHYFLVDEFQDTNFSQLAVLQRLVPPGNHICVVGDDDQSIYSWRGAMPEIMERFEAAFPGTRLIKLEQNYRCTNLILDAANGVIRHNQERKAKSLWSRKVGEEPILVKTARDEKAEAAWIAGRCLALLGRGYRPGDLGILYRANAQARAVEIALREHRLRYRIYGGSSFFEKPEVKDFLAFFRLILDPHDHMAFWRVLNIPARGFGLKTQERMEAQARQAGDSPYTVLREGGVSLNKTQARAGAALIAALETLREAPLQHPEDVRALGQNIIRSFDLMSYLRQKHPDEQSRRRKTDTMSRLPDWLHDMAEQQMEENDVLHVKDLVDRLALGDEKQKQEEKQEGQHISLMTIHAAKGLEFPAVFICGLEEELLPHKNSIASGSLREICEERRLFYVALTRAKDILHLSRARSRSTGFQSTPRKPSRFLQELPDEACRMESAAEEVRDKAAVRDRNLNRLADLKAQLERGRGL